MKTFFSLIVTKISVFAYGAAFIPSVNNAVKIRDFHLITNHSFKSYQLTMYFLCSFFFKSCLNFIRIIDNQEKIITSVFGCGFHLSLDPTELCIQVGCISFGMFDSVTVYN